MKYILASVFLIFGASQSKTQTLTQMQSASNGAETQAAYSSYIVNNNNFVLPTYAHGGDVAGNPYFSKDWASGTLTTVDNHVFGEGLVFMYSKVDGRLFFKETDSSVVMQADAAKILSFTLNTDKPHTFVRTDAFTKEYSGNFYEVLVRGEKKYSLLKLTTAEFEENTTAAASNVMTVTSSAGSFSDKVKYYICKDGQLTQVSLKKKSFQSTIASDKDKAEKYFQEHSGSFNEDAAIGLITEINAQVE